MDLKQRLESARKLAEQGTHGLDSAAHAKIEENWPAIQQLFQEKIGPAALAAVNDDAQMRSVLRLVHDALPFPLRLLVKEDAFVEFCLARRDRLLPRRDAAGA